MSGDSERGGERRRVMSNMSPDEQKAIIKEAITEWLDAQFARFGKYSLVAIMSAAFAALLYLYITTHGFKTP